MRPDSICFTWRLSPSRLNESLGKSLNALGKQSVSSFLSCQRVCMYNFMAVDYARFSISS